MTLARASLTRMERDDVRQLAERAIAERAGRWPAITANRVLMFVLNHAGGGMSGPRQATRRDAIRALRDLGYVQVGFDGYGHDREAAWARP